MENINAESPVYQYYTIISGEDQLTCDSQPQLAFYEEEDEEKDDNQIMYEYVALKNDETEDEAEISETLVQVEEPPAQPSISNMKLITFEDGQMYLTPSSLLDENLTAVQPQLVTHSNDNNVTTDGTQITSNDETTQSTDNSFHQIQLEDGTCAIISSNLWKSFLDNINNKPDPAKREKRFHCMNDGCDKVYSSGHHLAVHMRSHSGSRPFACTVEGCDKAFSTGYSLKAHLRTHTGEKPYGCSMCEKQFKTSGDLQKHIRTHTGEKPFKCPIEGCGRSFTTSNIRKVHIRSHTGERPYSCNYPECGKAFSSATNYKNHIRIHSGEKPYICSVNGCGKRFTEYSSLYKHNAVHQTSRPFRCSYCSQLFKQECSLKVHKRTVHNVLITEDGLEVSVGGNSSIFVELTPDTTSAAGTSDSFFCKDEVDCDNV